MTDEIGKTAASSAWGVAHRNTASSGAGSDALSAQQDEDAKAMEAYNKAVEKFLAAQMDITEKLNGLMAKAWGIESKRFGQDESRVS